MAIKLVVEAVRRALGKYNPENVDVILNEESNMLDIVYHSRHNSFDIESNVANANDIDLRKLELVLEEYDVGYVW